MKGFEHEKHQKMWHYLADNATNIIKDYESNSSSYDMQCRVAHRILDMWKAKWIDINDKGAYICNNCYACEYATTVAEDVYSICGSCPFVSQFMCIGEDSPYSKLLDAVMNKNSRCVKFWCEKIADYEITRKIKYTKMWVHLAEYIKETVHYYLKRIMNILQ